MSDDLTRVERRLEAVAAVGRVVQAVWALAHAQRGAAEAAAAESSVYLAWVEAVLERLAGRPAEVAPGERLTVVLGPEQAFCGQLPRRVADDLPPEGALGLVGARLRDLVALQPAARGRVVFELPGPTSPAELPQVARALASAILAHAAERSVELRYPTAARRELSVVSLLSGPREPVYDRPELLSPFEQVLAAVVEESVTGALVVGLAEALRVEVRARVVAAGEARQACQRKGDELLGQLRLARREQITREVQELATARLAGGS